MKKNTHIIWGNLLILLIQLLFVGCGPKIQLDLDSYSESIEETVREISDETEDNDYVIIEPPIEDSVGSIWATFYNANYDYSINLTNEIYDEFSNGRIMLEEENYLDYLLHEINFSYEKVIDGIVNRDVLCGVGVTNVDMKENYSKDLKDNQNGPAILHIINDEDIQFDINDLMYGSVFVSLDTFSGINYSCKKEDSGYNNTNLSLGFQKNLDIQTRAMLNNNISQLYKEDLNSTVLIYFNKDYHYSFEFPLKWMIDSKYKFLITTSNTEKADDKLHELNIQVYDSKNNIFDVLRILLKPTEFVKDGENIITKNDNYVLIIGEVTTLNDSDIELDKGEVIERCYFVD